MDMFADLDAIAQAALVKRGQASPLELGDAAIARIETLDPRLNAVIHRRFEEARVDASGADLPEGPFRGVPFLLKDAGATQAGFPQTRGNAALKHLGRRSSTETPLGSRFRSAGLVTLGITNMPEFGLVGDTQPLAFGPIRNPWDVEACVGGSSGGSCAAVASGMVPVAHGSDGAGSIRIPASWRGLVGLKPSRGRTQCRIDDEDLWLAEFVVSRTVCDAALMLDCVHDSVPGALYHQCPPDRPYAEFTRQSPPPLKVGLLTQHAHVDVDLECVVSVEQTGALLESLGHLVEPAYPTALFDVLPERLVEPSLAAGYLQDVFAAPETEIGRRVTADDAEPYSLALRREEPWVTARDAAAADAWHRDKSGRLAAWWADGFDLLVTPTMCELAPLLIEPSTLSLAGMGAAERRSVAFTETFNASGQPVISLPVQATAEGLPIGVQLVAAEGRKDLLLQVSRQLEDAIDWARRWPPVSAKALDGEEGSCASACC